MRREQRRKIQEQKFFLAPAASHSFHPVFLENNLIVTN